MAENTAWETIRAQGGQIVDELRKLLREGNVRRVVVKQKGRVVAEFPLTVGVVGALVAPVLAAIGALVAVLAECSIDVEKATASTPPVGRPRAAAPRSGKPRRASPGTRSTARR